jgi:hypothetical protein
MLTSKEDAPTMPTQNSEPNAQAAIEPPPPEGTAGQPQDGEPQVQSTSTAATSANGQAPDATPSGDKTPDQAVTLETLKELRNENASLRRRLRIAEGDEAKQTLEQQVTTLREELEARDTRDRDRSIRLAAITAAQSLKFRNPELAYRLLDRGSIEFDKEGEPMHVETALKQVLDANPYLALTEGDFGGGERGNIAPASTDMNTLLRNRGRSSG